MENSSLDETSQKPDLDQKENNQKESNDDFQIGQIIWSKLGKYPHWPSIVALDFETNTFVKGKPKEKEFSVHVRFCHDNGRHNWIKFQNVKQYLGKTDFLTKYPDALSFIKNNKNLLNQWNLAVEEADRLLAHKREARVPIFYSKYNITLPSVSTSNEPINVTEKAIVNDDQLCNSHESMKKSNTEVAKPKRKRKKKESTDDDVDDLIIELPDEPEIKTDKLHRLVPRERKEQIWNLESKRREKNIKKIIKKAKKN